MRWLIRRVLKKGKGAVSYEEDVHYGDVLTIGSRRSSVSCANSPGARPVAAP